MSKILCKNNIYIIIKILNFGIKLCIVLFFYIYMLDIFK